MNRADEIKGIITEDNKKCKHSSCRKAVCIDCLTQALLSNEEARMKPLRDFYEKACDPYINPEWEVIEMNKPNHKFMKAMWQAIKQSLGGVM